ncbi:tRNA (adenosine(37)-N6)-dimethylallyltransferase MiaA [Denitrobaculum tricleocarpae]|uniref:tRNA dimethylallyltransferase n=1 Tax=Denitrobaculum tricleocarpae TaxID=2591009 RepID=A0A545TXZ2_9PROT|nr:tRNA (adenosine(37)-N6)-dimethylallyltransferase MiaA [Denitrobaculum tricleocarpae]TQV82079.1 tRNA (adenosine(37)-N6)-dimethylallyltransferase MiaA [Denitrobaculum tricleocarpae]
MSAQPDQSENLKCLQTALASRPVVLVGGPTASGKSGLAADVAAAFNGVVINADSMQVYRELDIITARPSADELTKAPHRLFGVLSGAERCSAARWRALALAEIEAAFKAGRLPIVVGGTGLYLRTLEEGLAPVPEISEEVRQQTWRDFEQLGAEAFHRELARRDPEMAGRLNVGDTQRLLRAWEVLAATGTSLAEWQARQADNAAQLDPGLSLLKLAVIPPREVIYERCNARFEAMTAEGAIEEVEALLKLGLDPALPVMKAIGVREFGAYLAGELSLEAAVSKAQQETRRYAKRQMTWLRNQYASKNVIETQYSESLSPKIFNIIRQYLLTLP